MYVTTVEQNRLKYDGYIYATLTGRLLMQKKRINTEKESKSRLVVWIKIKEKLCQSPVRLPEGSIPTLCLAPPLRFATRSPSFDYKKKVRWGERNDLKIKTTKRCSPWPTRSRRTDHLVAAIIVVVKSNNFHLAAVSFVWLRWIPGQKQTKACEYWFLDNWKEAQYCFWYG